MTLMRQPVRLRDSANTDGSKPFPAASAGHDRESRRTFRGSEPRVSIAESGCDEMRDVGDVNAELKGAVREDFDIDGVVEIASGRGIDRDGVALSKIVAAGEIRLGESHREAVPLLLRLLLETDVGRPNFLMMTCVSTLGSSRNPMTDTILPAGQCAAVGEPVISTSTILSLCSEDIVGNEDLCRQFFVAGRDEEDLRRRIAAARRWFPAPAWSTLTMRPSARPPGFPQVISTCTLSPFIAEPVRVGGMKMSLSMPSTFFCGNDEAVAVAMQQDRPLDEIRAPALHSGFPCVGELSVFDELSRGCP